MQEGSRAFKIACLKKKGGELEGWALIFLLWDRKIQGAQSERTSDSNS